MLSSVVGAVILPYYKDGEPQGEEENSNKEIIYRRHIVDRMPIDGWNDVWKKLHQQIVNVEVFNVDVVSAEVYTTVATFVIWSMRLALFVSLYVWIDSITRPIYAKLIPCDLGTPTKKIRQPLKRQALGSLGKSRYVEKCTTSFGYLPLLLKFIGSKILFGSLCQGKIHISRGENWCNF